MRIVSKARQVCSRWNALRKEQGLGTAGQWALDRVGKYILDIRISDFLCLERQRIQLAGAPPKEFEFRFLTAEEITRFVSAEYELDERYIRRVAGGHDLCFAALYQDRLAAYGWYALGSVEAEHCDNVALSFPADTTYMYKGFTHPDYRGQRLHGFAIRLAFEALAAERRIVRMVSTVDWLNVASRKSCERLGFYRLGRILRVGRPFHLASSLEAARSMGIRFGRDADLSNRQSSQDCSSDLAYAT